MNTIYNVEDRVEDELKQICKKPEWSPSDIEMIYKMIDILKDTSTIEAMKEAGYSQASARMSYDDPGMAYTNRGNSYDDYSYRRGRDSMGRYTSRDGYSGHDKESMIEGLREKMHMATNESDREAIRRAIDVLER
jgi:hypothetical protein